MRAEHDEREEGEVAASRASETSKTRGSVATREEMDRDSAERLARRDTHERE